RHVEDDAVAFADAEIVMQDSGKRLGLGLQRGVGEGLLLAGDRRVVDEGGLGTAAGFDVSIDRIVAGVTDAIRKPAAIDAGLGVEHRLRLLNPVNGLRRFTPKAIRIALPARIDLVITARPGVHGVSPAAIVARTAAFASAAPADVLSPARGEGTSRHACANRTGVRPTAALICPAFRFTPRAPGPRGIAEE